MRKKIEENEFLIGKKPIRSKRDAKNLIYSLKEWDTYIPNEENKMSWFEFMCGSDVVCISRIWGDFHLSDQSADMRYKSTNLVCEWSDKSFFHPSIKKLIDYIYDERKSINASIRNANKRRKK